MKLNATPRHYMPLPQNQSDDDESGPGKEDKEGKVTFKSSFDAHEGLSKRTRQVGADDVDPKSLPMSISRMVLFILSLLLCVLFILVFVYVVPCTWAEAEICHLTYKWKKGFRNMSFTSPLDFAYQEKSGSQLIILGYTGEESGLMAIRQWNGEEFWRIPLHSVPISSFCNVVDVNSDGILECLVLGHNGLLAAIEVQKGVSLWYLHNHSDLSDAYSIDGPIFVPDFDGDGIVDILISYNVGDSDNISHMALVSGGTGQIIGSLVELPQCFGPTKVYFTWKSHNDTYLVLRCTGQKYDNLLLLSSRDVFDVVFNENSSLSMHNIFRIPQFVQDIQFFKISSSENRLIIVLNGIKFMLLQISHQLDSEVIWELNEEYDQPMRILVEGHFVNGSSQLVITGSSTYHSKVIGLSLTNGKEEWSFFNDNASIRSATKLPNFFGSVDGLILKALTLTSFADTQNLNENFGNTSTDQNSNDINPKKTAGDNLELLEENYILVKCGKVPLMKTLSTEEIKMICKANGVCHPNVYSTNSTVLIKSTQQVHSFDMFTVTSTVHSPNNAEEMIVKYLNLHNIFTVPKCAG